MEPQILKLISTKLPDYSSSQQAEVQRLFIEHIIVCAIEKSENDSLDNLSKRPYLSPNDIFTLLKKTDLDDKETLEKEFMSFIKEYGLIN